MQTNTTQMPPLESLRPLSEFTELLGVDRTTLFRWATIGVKPGPVLLNAWQVKEWMTTDEEVRSFIQRRTAAKLHKASQPGPSTATEANKRVKAAAKQLAAKGVKRHPASK